jgi:hypothetical protein
MSEPIKITATVAAWLPGHKTPNDLLAAIERGDNVGLVGSCLWFYGAPDKTAFGDYVRVGEAEITVTLMPRDEQVRLAVQMLQKQLEAARAEWMERQRAIMAEISKLQAIEYTPEVQA